MKKRFEIILEADNENDLINKFDVVENLALATDFKYIKLIYELNKKIICDNLRSRTKEERQQRADFFGFNFWEDIAQ